MNSNNSIFEDPAIDSNEVQNLLSILIFEIARRVNIFAVLFVISTGLIGNSLIIFVFIQSRFRTNSSNVFLLYLALVDTCYLILHFFEDTVRNYNIIYLSNPFNESLYLSNSTAKSSYSPISSFNYLMRLLNISNRNELLCRSVNYLRYSFRFASAYIVVTITFQRLLLIYCPFSAKLKSKKTAWLIVNLLMFTGLIVNIWVFCMHKIQLNDDKVYCDVAKAYQKEYFIITCVYIFLVIVIPILIILICNSLIICRTNTNEAKRRKMLTKARSFRDTSSGHNFRKRYKTVANFKLKRYYCNVEQATNQISQKLDETSKKVKKILIFISVSYALFNLPYLIVWLVYFYRISFTDVSDALENYLFASLQIAEIFNVLNYGLKFYIFCATGSKFRKQLYYSSRNLLC